MTTVCASERAWSVSDSAAPVTEWQFSRRCSLTPSQLQLSYAAVVLLCSLVAIVFGSRGYWMIALFCFAEIVVAGAMYLHHCLHALDGERITLGPDGMVSVEVTRGLRRRRYLMNAAWVRLERGTTSLHRLWLCYKGTRVEVATQLNQQDKATAWRQLRNVFAVWR